MDSLAERILEYLRNANGSQKARSIAKHFQVPRRKVNTLLYGKLAESVVKDELHQWSLRGESHKQESSPTIKRNFNDGTLENANLTIDQKVFALRRLQEFVFSARVTKIFKKFRVDRVGDLLPYSPDELRKLKNIGRRSVEELERFLAQRDLKLGCAIPSWNKETIGDWEEQFRSNVENARIHDATTLINNAQIEGASSAVKGELLSLLHATWGPQKRNAEIVCALLGWDGSGAKTLEEVGDLYGITRERVRQVKKKFFERLTGKLILLPKVTCALDLIEMLAPQLETAICQKLLEEGLIDAGFNIEALLNLGPFLKRHVSLQIVSTHGLSVVGRPETLIDVGRAVSIARAKVSHYGCVHIEEICESFVTEAISLEIIRPILSTQNRIRWLSSERDWLTFDDNARNRLENVVRKILSVSRALAVSELRVAISRVHRLDGFIPPRTILLEFCRGLPFSRVEGERVIAKEELNPTEELGETEGTFWRVLCRNNGVMSSQELERQCLEEGMNPNTFFQFLSYSPILFRLARGVYCLPGVPVTPGLVTSLMPRYSKSNTLKDHGWTNSGHIWIAYRLNKSNMRSGAFSIPVSLSGFLSEEYELLSPDGAKLGSASIKPGRVTGLRKPIRFRGGDEGDLILLTFDLSHRSATFVIGDEDLIIETDRLS